MSRQNVNEDRERETVEARAELLCLAEAEAKVDRLTSVVEKLVE